MNEINKTTMTHDDAVPIPLVQASFVAINAEPFRAIRTEYVVIDEYFGNQNNSAEPSLESSYSDFSTVAESITQNIDPQDSNWNHDHPQDCDVQYSKVDQSKTYGAWAAGIVLGFLMGGGPSLSIAFGIGAAYFSQQEEGVAGEVARAIGDVALLSREKFVEVNEKHNLIDTVATGTIAFSRNCLVSVRSLFSAADKNNHGPTRQMNTNDTETT